MARKTTTPPTTRGPRISDEQMRARGMTPFLRPEHVSKDIPEFRMTGFNRKGNDGQFLCDVERGDGDIFTLGIREGSPDHRVLFNAFGGDYTRWTGTVAVKIVNGRQAGTQFVNVESASKSAPAWALAPASDEQTEG